MTASAARSATGRPRSSSACSGSRALRHCRGSTRSARPRWRSASGSTRSRWARPRRETAAVDDADLELRNLTYGHFVELGRAPTAHEMGERLGVTADEVRTAWARLHEAHALVLSPAQELLMVNPFSAVPSAHRVHAAGRWWYANCAWD